MLAQEIELLLMLDSFRDHLQPELVRHPEDRLRDDPAAAVGDAVLDELRRDLQGP